MHLKCISKARFSRTCDLKAAEAVSASTTHVERELEVVSVIIPMSAE